MTFQIVIEKPVAKFISKLPQTDKERVLRAIRKLPEWDVKALQGQKSKVFIDLGSVITGLFTPLITENLS